MMDGMGSIRRTIYDKFGNVMKSFKLDSDNQGSSKTIDQSSIDTAADGIEGSSEVRDAVPDVLWDLSELDPEIYEDVFEPTLEGRIPPLLQNTMSASELVAEA